MITNIMIPIVSIHPWCLIVSDTSNRRQHDIGSFYRPRSGVCRHELNTPQPLTGPGDWGVRARGFFPGFRSLIHPTKTWCVLGQSSLQKQSMNKGIAGPHYADNTPLR